jgi:hypothetical protein
MGTKTDRDSGDTLENALCEELAPFLGEVKDSEGALDVLRRITAELRQLRASQSSQRS